MRSPVTIRREPSNSYVMPQALVVPYTFLDIVLQFAKIRMMTFACHEFLTTNDFKQSKDLEKLMQISIQLSTVIVDIIKTSEIKKIKSLARALQEYYPDMMNVVGEDINAYISIFEKIKMHSIMEPRSAYIGLTFKVMMQRVIPDQREQFKKIIRDRINSYGKKNENNQARAEELLTTYIENCDIIDCTQVIAEISSETKSIVNTCISNLGKKNAGLGSLVAIFNAFSEVLNMNTTIANSLLEEDERIHLDKTIEQYFKFHSERRDYPAHIKRAIRSIDNIAPIYTFTQKDLAIFLTHDLSGTSTYLQRVYQRASAVVYRTYAAIAFISIGYDDLSKILTHTKEQFEKENADYVDHYRNYPNEVRGVRSRYLPETIALIDKEIRCLSQYFQIGMRFSMPISNMVENLQRLLKELSAQSVMKRDTEDAIAQLNQCIDFFKQKTIGVQIAKAISNYILKMDQEVDVKNKKNKFKFWNQDRRLETRPILIAILTYLSNILDADSSLEVTNLQGVHSRVLEIIDAHHFDRADKRNTNSKDKGIKLIFEVLNGITNLMKTYHQMEPQAKEEDHPVQHYKH